MKVHVLRIGEDLRRIIGYLEHNGYDTAAKICSVLLQDLQELQGNSLGLYCLNMNKQQCENAVAAMQQISVDIANKDYSSAVVRADELRTKNLLETCVPSNRVY